MSEQNNNNLNQHERDFINCFSEFYKWQGRSETLGLVFGVLFLRTASPGKGLTQKEITTLIGKSKSTVSRILDLLIDQGFCKYNLEENDDTRAERQYSVKGSFKEISISRTQKSIIENDSLKYNLQKIKDNVPEDEIHQNSGLLHQIASFSELINLLNLSEKNTLELLQNLYKNES